MAKTMVMCVIFFAGLLHCVNAADINAYGINYGNINAKSTVDGSLNIDDGDITIVYGIGGHSDQVRIFRRADIGGNEYVKKMEKESSIYVSDTADIIYHQDLKRDGTTVSYGLVYENGVLQYFNGRGQVLVLPENKAGAEYSKLAPDFNCTQPKDRTLHAKHTAAEDLDTVAVIKLLVFVDSAVVDR
ncbi:hypothetical protein DPMN_071921 [Dreissena polymorpha]|uniref:Uncharacterized protein n=1 Tax=Dreissena polymorpha TaxID=45954 RepID=A0A9D4BW46_DREPO|nr:hypothetical protein DPMN_071921 [Dreissena polymorpha]